MSVVKTNGRSEERMTVSELLDRLSTRRTFRPAGLAGELQLDTSAAAKLNGYLKAMAVCPECYTSIATGEEVDVLHEDGSLTLIHTTCVLKHRRGKRLSVLDLCKQLGIQSSIGTLYHADRSSSTNGNGHSHRTSRKAAPRIRRADRAVPHSVAKPR